MKRIAISLLLLLSGVLCFGQYDKDVFNFRGRRALSEGKYADAIQQFNILARLDTTDYWTFFFRGIAKYNLGDLRSESTTRPSRTLKRPSRCDPVRLASITAGV